MKLILVTLLALALTSIVTAECITEENRAVKNGVNFPNYCYSEETLVRNYCVNETVEQEYVECNCVNDICIEGTNETCTGDTCLVENNETKYCNSEWICDHWTECQNGMQTRACTDVNVCTEEYTKTEEQNCTPEPIPVGNTPDSTWLWIAVLVVIAVIVTGYFLMRKKEEPEKRNLTNS